MFSTHIFSLQPALNLKNSLPSRLEELARQTLAGVEHTRQELTPLVKQASARARDVAAKATRQAAYVVETRVIPVVAQKVVPVVRPLVERKFNLNLKPGTIKAVDTAEGLPAYPAESPVRSVKLGPLMTARLTLQLLFLAVAERVREAAAPAKPKSPWLISKNDDLIYMIGSSAVSYLFMAMIFLFKVKPSTVFWIYVLFFDGPHIFGTFSRTYADPEEWQKRRKLFLWSLLLFVPGPVMVRLGLGEYFDIFAYMWAYYHLVKQHYGFSILYKKKNDDLAKIDNYLDKALIWTGFTLPFVNFLFSPNYPKNYTRVADFLPSWTPKLVATAFFTTLTAYLGRQVYKLANGQKIDLPKQMLLASSITMHNVTFRLPFGKLGDGGISNLAPIVAILTVYHNIQYNRLIWFHNQNKYVKGAQKGQTFGLASTLSKNGKRFALVAFLFGASYRLPIGILGGGKGVSPKMAKYITAFGWGFAFVHYYLDSKIWRVRHDQRLGSALKVNSTPAPAAAN